MIIKTINRLLQNHDDLYDLNDWRDWFSNIISHLFVILLPVSFMYLFPDFIRRGLYYLIAIDLILWIYLLARAFKPDFFSRIRNFIWIVFIYAMTISYYLNLGPNYARPGWMMMCAIVSAIFYGVKGALISSVFNAGILIAFFFLTDAADNGWISVHNEGLKSWIIFIGNFTLLSICSSVAVGFLINRLNRSLHIERNIKEELQATNEELSATLEEMEAVNEEFESQNNELLISTNALKESEQELKEIFNSTHDAFIIHDIDGRIFDVNNRMLEMFRLTRDKALSLNISDISSNGTDVTQIGNSWHRIARGETILFEWKALRPDDNTGFDIEVALRKLKWHGTEVILSSLRDLTERKNAEAEHQRVQAQLVQAQKMEAVGTLAGGIAHDFNNVLGGIIGSLSLLNLLLKEEPLVKNDEIAEYLQIATESSKRAADITKQLLVLSRKREIQMTPVAISDSINRVMNICKSSFPKIVELNFQPVEPSLKILADPAQIEQVLLNLCMNASHAMTIMRNENDPQGGTLTVESGQFICDRRFNAIHPESVPGSKYLQIRVIDTGIGMNKECRERIFEPFFTTKEIDTGSGLGLAITYTIVMQHKGFIDVYSEPGKGSIFTVYLPQIDDNLVYPSDERTEIIMGSGRILIIDDEASMLLVARGILNKCGYTAVTAISPIRGIELFRNSHETFDAVLIDNAMPGMSGLNLYLAMREIVPDVKVMLCSGYMDDDTIEICRRNGIREFIHKPYSAEELSFKIHSLLNSGIKNSGD